MFTLIYVDMGIMILPVWAKNQKFSKFHIQYIWKIVRAWHHQLAHLNIHKDWSRNVFRKNVKFQNGLNFLISYPIFIIFAPICREIFTLSFEIMVILDWTSPLKPQDSFGEFNNFFLDLQKVQEIIRKHHQTFLQLFWMTYCNAILPRGKVSLCT